MNTRSLCRSLWLSLSLLVAGRAAVAAEDAARPFVHPLFTDHMVFPRDRQAPLWGWASPGAHVHLSLGGATAEAVAAADGRWQATLGPLAAGGPYELVIDGPQHVVRSDVMVGDVWLFSGQSNMEFGLGGATGGAEEMAQAGTVADLRLLYLGHRLAGRPAVVPPGSSASWFHPASNNVGGFSAVAWFTGRTLAKELHVPIGLVTCAWSGSNIRGWMSEGALGALDLYGDERAALQPLALVEAKGGALVSAQEQALIDAWWTANDPGTANNWQQSTVSDGAAPWKSLNIPGRWSDLGAPADGVAWIRRDFDLPPAAAGQAGRVFLGGISDEEVTWINGVRVGSTGGWNQPRQHIVPTGVLRVGRNVIALRVWSTGGRGSALGATSDWHIDVGGPAAPVSLAGPWRFALSTAAANLPPRPEPRFQGGNKSSTMLFNGGIAPLAPFAFKGVVWYQGEQDAGNQDYQRLLPGLIADWRALFSAPQLPFVVVQLPAFHERSPLPVESPLWFGEVRAAQLSAARQVPGVGLAVTTDVGDAANVHPPRKREVGERAAHAALAVAYGGDDGGGPLFSTAVVEGQGIRVRFTQFHGGLEMRAGDPSGFAIRGSDGKWQHATATVAVDGLSVLVGAASVPQPLAVRYGWAENPSVTLYDKAGMPASPFRSDQP